MENVSNVDKLESIKSFQSTIGKSENALAQMTQKGSNTTLLKKRLKALYIGLAVLENVWNQGPPHYTQEDLAEARNILTGLIPSIETIYAKSKAGSPQRTLLERKIKSLELAVVPSRLFRKFVCSLTLFVRILLQCSKGNSV